MYVFIWAFVALILIPISIELEMQHVYSLASFGLATVFDAMAKAKATTFCQADTARVGLFGVNFKTFYV